VRVVVFQRDGRWFAARVQGTEDETTTAIAEAAATPIAVERIAQMELVIAGIEMSPSASPYAACPRLVVDTTARHFESGGCVDGEGMRDPNAPEPSTNRYEVAWRLLQLLPRPPASPLGEPGPRL
jgi:hypothetical protein